MERLTKLYFIYSATSACLVQSLAVGQEQAICVFCKDFLTLSDRTFLKRCTFLWTTALPWMKKKSFQFNVCIFFVDFMKFISSSKRKTKIVEKLIMIKKKKVLINQNFDIFSHNLDLLNQNFDWPGAFFTVVMNLSPFCFYQMHIKTF